MPRCWPCASFTLPESVLTFSVKARRCCSSTPTTTPWQTVRSHLTSPTLEKEEAGISSSPSRVTATARLISGSALRVIRGARSLSNRAAALTAESPGRRSTATQSTRNAEDGNSNVGGRARHSASSDVLNPSRKVLLDLLLSALGSQVVLLGIGAEANHHDTGLIQGGGAQVTV